MTNIIEFSRTHTLPDELVQGQDVFACMMQQQGLSYRKVAGRETLKISLGGRSYFIKKHFGVGWLEILKNWLSFKRPVLSALNEVHAIHVLQQLGIPTTPYVAHGVQGCLPASLRSFVLTEDLGEIVTLEDLVLQWQTQGTDLRFKRALIRRVAEIARQLHTQGIYHRDFYVCHFCIKLSEIDNLPPRLHVLDLHRAEIRPTLSNVMQMKDLAALYFSAMDAGLSRADKWLFLLIYTGMEPNQLRTVVDSYHPVELRAQRLYEKYQRKLRAGVSM